MAEPQCLTQEEIDTFVSELDKDKDGCISYSELKFKLDKVCNELEPDAKEHHLHHDSRKDDQRHELLRSMIGSEKCALPVEEFKKIVKSWRIPSLEQDKQAAKDEDDYLRNISWSRRLRSYWEVDGPNWVFLSVVVGLQIGIWIWQCVKYATGEEYQAAFGWGTGQGQRWRTLSDAFLPGAQFINWDLSQSFHVKMSVVALIFATPHAIGHLSGTFVFVSMSDRQAAVAALLGPDAVPRPYVTYARTLPGWSGLTALGLFYAIAMLSMPSVRKCSYEIFQAAHLLMFLFLGLLMAHGTLKLLQYPLLGFILAFPTLLVLAERVTRFLAGFHKIPARLEILDSETVAITCTIPDRRIWNYKAGQYVFLQVPQVSFFQWHPFTISTCSGREMTLHIKTDGDWTSKLRDMQDLKFVGIDGPFGAPAQRFYDFDQAVIVGAGIGVTPFSGILSDLQMRENHQWKNTRRSTSTHDSDATAAALDTGASSEEKDCDRAVQETTDSTLPSGRMVDFSLYRRADFHWIVCDQNHPLWFSSLLNRISLPPHDPHLEVNIYNHLTKKRKNLSLHVFRWLLETHRTPSQSMSPLTGLIAPTQFGRPDFPKIMNEHYEEMIQLFAKDAKRKRRVGVFFCGAPVIGRALADLCRELTVRGRQEGTGIEYHFMIEVFG